MEMFTMDTDCRYCNCSGGDTNVKKIISEIARLDERCDMAFKQFNEASDIANTFYEKIAELQVWRRDVEVLIQGVAKSFATRLPF